MNHTIAPSLFATPMAPRAESGRTARSLFDLMYDGFYLLLLLRNKHLPSDASALAQRVRQFLDGVETDSKRLNIATEDVYEAKYAFCAAVDEFVLSSGAALRNDWERQPLQLVLFGDQLAGEHFYTRLEALRQQGVSRLQAIEVFHMCLLLGFKGKYMLDGSEKLNYEVARLGDEIAHLRGKRAEFAPHGLPPDRVANALRTQMPWWGIAAGFALIALLAWWGMNTLLGRQAERMLANYNEVVKLAPRAANLTITLP